MAYKKILVGVDFSEQTDTALSQALVIARRLDAEVVLAHATYVPQQPEGYELPASTTAALREMQAKLNKEVGDARARLEAMREQASYDNGRISHVLFDGPPDAALPKAAEELGCDLIVLGSHGRTGLPRFFLGSVAERVCRMAECDVLIAKGEANAQRLDKILVPVDYSLHAHKAFDQAAELVSDSGRIDLLHCWEFPGPGHYLRAYDKLLSDVEDGVKATSEKRAEPFFEQARAQNLKISLETLRTNPVTGITERASDYDLVVMGTHGHRGFRRFLLGSVAEHTIRHSPVSVLVVHGKDA